MVPPLFYLKLSRTHRWLLHHMKSNTYKIITGARLFESAASLLTEHEFKPHSLQTFERL